jgi:hypothetical protein
MAEPAKFTLHAPVYLLGSHEVGYIVKDDGSVPIWTSEERVTDFIHDHSDLHWIPIDYTEIKDDLALLANLRRLRGKGARTVAIDPRDVDQQSDRVFDLEHLIASLSQSTLPAENSPSGLGVDESEEA